MSTSSATKRHPSPVLIAVGLSLAMAGTIIYLAVALGLSEAAREDLAREAAKVAKVAKAAAKRAATQDQGRRPRMVVTRPFKPVNFTIDFFGMRYLGRSSHLIDMHVFFYGAFEKYLLFFMRDTLRSLTSASGPQKAGTYVDVGANKGHHALFMSQYAKQVHAIEPFQPVLVPFRQMIALNKVTNIAIHPVGLGDTDQKLTFYVPPTKNRGTGTFVKAYVADKNKSKILPVVTGDSLFRKLGLEQIDLIKIDIEGFEKKALRGMSKTLRKMRPVVLFEVTVDPSIPAFFKSMQEIRSMFPADYRFRSIEGKDKQGQVHGKYRVRPVIIDFSKVRQFDLAAFPPEKEKHCLGRN